MTNEEAKLRIENLKIRHRMREPRAIYTTKALDMATAALSFQSGVEAARAEIERIANEKAVVAAELKDPNKKLATLMVEGAYRLCLEILDECIQKEDVRLPWTTEHSD